MQARQTALRRFWWRLWPSPPTNYGRSAADEARRALAAIPQVPGPPLIGNAFDLAGDLRAFLTEQYLKLGPVFRVSAFHRQYVVMAGVEANRFFAGSGKGYFRNRETWQDFVEEMGAERAMLALDGPDHLRYRREQKRAYSRRYAEERLEEAANIARREIEAWPIAEPIRGHYALQRIITEQLGVLAASTSPRRYLDDLIVFVESMLLTHVLHQRPRVYLKLPHIRRAAKRVERLYQEVRAGHTPEKREGQPPDLIDDLLDLHRRDPRFFPERDMKVHMMGPFIAGLDTAAASCAFMLYALLKHPDVLAEMRKEADELFSGGAPTIEKVRTLDVTHRVAMETLRMYPIAPAVFRTTIDSFDFGGHTIPAGSKVIIGTTVPHYLPEFFPEPERFDIDRYGPERKEHMQPGRYAPFSLGTHRCLGFGFAEFQIAITMAAVVHYVDMELDPPDWELRTTSAPTPKPNKRFKFRVVRYR